MTAVRQGRGSTRQAQSFHGTAVITADNRTGRLSGFQRNSGSVEMRRGGDRNGE